MCLWNSVCLVKVQCEGFYGCGCEVVDCSRLFHLPLVGGLLKAQWRKLSLFCPFWASVETRDVNSYWQF